MQTFSKLKGRMKELNLTQEDVSHALGISIQSFNKKINGKVPFKLEEVVVITDLLDISSEVKEYFFN